VERAVGLRGELRHNRPVYADIRMQDGRGRKHALFPQCFHVNEGVRLASLKVKAALHHLAVTEMAGRRFRKLSPIGDFVQRYALAEDFSGLVAAQLERTVGVLKKTEWAEQPDIVGFAFAAVHNRGVTARGDIVFKANLVMFLVRGYFAWGSLVLNGRN